MEKTRVKPVVLRLDEKLLAAVDKCAIQQRLTRTEWLRISAMRSLKYDNAIVLPNVRAVFGNDTDDGQPC
jgi:hypothetical protein